MKLSKTFLSGAAIAALTLFTGCEQAQTQTPNDPTVSEGQLIDSAVEGVQYITPSQSGTTDAQGTFKYVAGETVQFKLGNLDLGTVDGAATVLPTDLAGDDNVTSAAVLARLLILQSLDEDQNASNGITIPSDIRNMTFTEQNLSNPIAIISEANTTSASTLNVVDGANAIAHFKETKFGLYTKTINTGSTSVAFIYNNAADSICEAAKTAAGASDLLEYVDLPSAKTCAEVGYQTGVGSCTENDYSTYLGGVTAGTNNCAYFTK